jgi:hypothetical protein
MHYLSSVNFVSQPLHVSGISVAHHQEVYCVYTTIGTCWPANRQSTEKQNMYQLLCVYIYIYTHTHTVYLLNGLQICPRHVEVDWWNILRITSASSWFLLHRSTIKLCCRNKQIYLQNLNFFPEAGTTHSGHVWGLSSFYHVCQKKVTKMCCPLLSLYVSLSASMQQITYYSNFHGIWAWVFVKKYICIYSSCN